MYPGSQKGTLNRAARSTSDGGGRPVKAGIKLSD